ncbi:hypothetical protein CSC17_5407 [Klebsiella oxytoca]|nr:hypothetical protein CSC17_5407 [Klebsiella oxytoca]EUC86641.1 hypothetical protein HMPREF1570_1865 [Klebsiella oxytoca KA-2]EUC92468.1 hypothetical protein HMPREF1569_2546 [Klebsiella oxytoca OK-1]
MRLYLTPVYNLSLSINLLLTIIRRAGKRTLCVNRASLISLFN